MEHRPGFGHHLRLLRELENPDGRLKDGQLESDRSGDSFTGTRSQAGRRAMHHEHGAHEHLIERFAREIARELSHARAEGLFGQLILVAEPHFLGLLRDALDTATTRLVVRSVTKDLAAVSPYAVATHIADALPL
jgi:protein required for attachment to host cells